LSKTENIFEFMDKKLFTTLKDKCKDMGLSESALQEIANSYADGLTEQTSAEDFEKVVNRCVSTAKIMQGEATRWAQSKKQTTDPPKDDKSKGGGQSNEIPEWYKEEQRKQAERMEALEKENKDYKAKQTKAERNAAIQTEITKLGIPDYLSKRLRFEDETSIEDVTKELTEFKQDLITQKLMPEDSTESRTTSEAATEERGKALYDQYVAKDTAETNN